MRYTRREMLGVTTLGLAGLAGCVGNLRPGSSSTSTPASNEQATTEQQSETTESTPETTATPEPEAASQTDRIVSEIKWFATKYDSAMRGYKINVRRVRNKVRDLRKQQTLSMADISSFEEVNRKLATFSSERLAPHFEVDPRLTTTRNTFVRRLEDAVKKGDDEKRRETLGTMAGFYDVVGTDTYIRKHLSDRPARDPLHGYLLSSSNAKAIFAISYPDEGFTTYTYADEYTPTSGEDEPKSDPLVHAHTFDKGHVVYAHAHEHDVDHNLDDHENEPESGRLYAFKDGAIDILKDSKLWRERLLDYEPAYEDVFAPLSYPEERTEHVYITVNDVTEAFTAHPLYIQQYADATAAQAAWDALFESTMTEVGTKMLGDSEWTKAYYDLDGPNMYVDVRRHGRYIYASYPSPKEHYKRPAWTDQFKHAWLAAESSDGTSN